MKLIVALFLIAFVTANLLVKHFGVYGLWISSTILIPFDFVCRCVIHERLKGYKLLSTLFFLTLLAGVITIAVNHDAVQIALASIAGFTAAQIAAGLFYQAALAERKSLFVKVNMSDLVGIIFDSLIFQLIAFSHFNPLVTGGQVAIKFIGGLFWYWLIFVKLKSYREKTFFSRQLERDNQIFEVYFKTNTNDK